MFADSSADVGDEVTDVIRRTLPLFNTTAWVGHLESLLESLLKRRQANDR